MVAFEIIFVIAVQIDSVDVIPTGTVHAAVAAVIGAVGVGQGKDEEIYIVKDVEDA